MADFFTRFVIVERGTIQHECAINAGMRYDPIPDDRDMLKYVADDSIIWQEYRAYITANKKAIQKEINSRYTL